MTLYSKLTLRMSGTSSQRGRGVWFAYDIEQRIGAVLWQKEQSCMSTCSRLENGVKPVVNGVRISKRKMAHLSDGFRRDGGAVTASPTVTIPACSTMPYTPKYAALG